ncbi:polysaccharide biosynthesis/export family protein [Avibacterium paragallinarum]|uniref:Polysaccharide export protein n=1 Tax=Avibacterium paragallinarum TaxID=728 RepID=A0A380Z1N3_AVIPA|nr:polysaccharide biosynthesis/export family protein [Avibacterium paragallinarum]KAA6208746.1 polysaccharide export protein [Avibacterium paragallinarum]RZN58417.1 polysaccharide export protein [Avibacterium paragallinarum]RZN73707.1 polysaccharide export protein [Avibacterium paragallinarum]SUV40897.1 polysaccharide export protein Wza [Avibacterium paragallinarum]
MRKHIIAVSCCLLVSCANLPNSGPDKSSIEKVEQQNTNVPTVQLIKLDDKVVGSDSFQVQSFKQLASSKQHYQGVVNAGDLLDITLWEAPPAILFGSVLDESGVSASQSTRLPEQMVSNNGRVTIPFIGSLRVAGKTPEQIQTDIVNRLQSIANQPQAIVRVVKNNSANVTVLTKAAAVRMPLTTYGERVLDAVTAAGGVSGDLQDISVQLTRNNQVNTISLAKLAREPQENILLRSGDVLSLLNNPLSFTAMGAVGNSKEIRFSAEGLSLAEAIGRLGGLNDNRADPRGVFIFRYIPFEELSLADQQQWQEKGFHNGMKIPTVYQANLLEPQSMFWIQQFPIKDKDIVYVSNAPLAEFQKFLRMIFGSTSPALSTINSINNM